MSFFTSQQIEQLKWLAIGSMVLDHTAILFTPLYPKLEILRVLGRFSFLAFGMLVAANLARDNLKLTLYFRWMLSFAVISAIPYYLFFQQYIPLNILFQFCAVICVIYAYKYYLGGSDIYRLSLYTIGIILSAISDYQLGGLIYCLLCYWFVQHQSVWHQKLGKMCLIVAALFANMELMLRYSGSILMSILVLVICISVLFITDTQAFCNCDCCAVKRTPKIFFYLFYPLHLLILVFIQQAIF